MKASAINSRDTKWVFIKKGSCSRTLFYILNREFGNPLEEEERAADLLAGGILQQGYQCGLLLGAVLAMGAESHRKSQTSTEAIHLAVQATQKIMESFSKRAGSVDCLDITEIDFKQNGGLARFLVKGKFVGCFRLADRWAPEAIKAAKEAMPDKPADTSDESGTSDQLVSCASEVVRKMGGNEQEMAIVAGLAGGVGLSGNACGALSAAVWMHALRWCREHPGKSATKVPGANQALEAFFAATDYEFLCEKITGKCFKTVDAHSEFICAGGCKELLDALAAS